ncbi:MAG TPA: hypothetical protein VFS34_09455 [Thermoanaerobaculia bacterium]|nr:hypothetical protein [Thermoanaerobaculia bacterium]
MSWGCRRVDRALRREERLEGAAAKHAANCARCAARVAAFSRIDEAAPSLRKSWDSPDLLGRTLDAMRESPGPVPSRPEPSPVRRPLSPWIPLAYAAALVAISTIGLWVFRDVPSRNPFSGARSESPFLGEDAMRDVEKKEAAYVASIEHLSALADAKTPEPASALAASYRERLLVIDSAIAECRAQIDQNRFNAHLRRQLLAMYGEKKRTLEDLLKEVSS